MWTAFGKPHTDFPNELGYRTLKTKTLLKNKNRPAGGSTYASASTLLAILLAISAPSVLRCALPAFQALLHLAATDGHLFGRDVAPRRAEVGARRLLARDRARDAVFRPRGGARAPGDGSGCGRDGQGRARQRRAREREVNTRRDRRGEIPTPFKMWIAFGKPHPDFPNELGFTLKTNTL